MQLERMRMNGSGKWANLEIEFTPVRTVDLGQMALSVLVGENGTGKTRVLNFLSRALTGIYRPTKAESFDVSFRIQRRVGHIGKLPGEKTQTGDCLPQRVIVSTYSPFDPFPKGMSRSRNNGEEPGPYVYVGTAGMMRGLSGAYLPTLEGLFSRSEKHRRGVGNLCKMVGYDDVPLVIVNPRPRSPLARINGRERGGGSFLDALRHHLEHQAVDWAALERLDAFHRSLPPSRALGPELNTRLSLHSSVVVSESDMNTYPGGRNAWLGDLRAAEAVGLRFIAEVLFHSRSGGLVAMSEMSSGELTLFYRFFRILQVMADDSLVFIDEPEVHLHPKWIQGYTSRLQEILGHFRTHVIIATHSPVLVADVPYESIIRLKYDQKARQVRAERIWDRTFGASQVEILGEVFEVSETPSGIAGDIVEEVQRLIKRGSYEEALHRLRLLGESPAKFDLFCDIRRRMKPKE